MAQFKDREEYEKWKAERLRQASQTAQQGIQDSGPSKPQGAGRRQGDPVRTGLCPVGELFSSSWEAYKKRFGTLISLYLISLLLLIVPLGIFLGGGFALSKVFPDAKGVLIGSGGVVGSLISFIMIFWGMAGLVFAVTDESLGISSALGRGWSRVWSFIWLCSVLGFVITGGFLLFFIPGVFFLVWFGFSQFILADDDERGMNAMLRSTEYVRGYGGAVFLRTLIIWVVSLLLGIIPFVGPILSILFFPFMMIYLYQIYRELKDLQNVSLFSPSAGAKTKWILVSLLGYILIPVIMVAVFGGAFLTQFLALKSLMGKPGSGFTFSPPSPKQQASNVVRPSNFNELLGTWTGSEIGRGSGWTFTFSEGYNVHVVSPSGEWYRGKAGIHFDLGASGSGMRVPPGAGILDIDISESSVGNYSGKITLGAFSIFNGTTMKLCGGEPGKTKRPESFEPTSGMRCFELSRISGPPPASKHVQPSMPEVPAVQPPAASSGDVAEAREAFKKCVAAYKSGNIEETKRYVATTTLAEMEQSGMFDMAMGMTSSLNIDEFVASESRNRMTFKKSEKQGDMSMSMSITMVKENGQWKLGK